jgi:hypothetical protein
MMAVIRTICSRASELTGPVVDGFSLPVGDLKSSNILLCVAPTAPYGRTAKVADFGLARVYAAGETHKSTRTLGTVSKAGLVDDVWFMICGAAVVPVGGSCWALHIYC